MERRKKGRIILRAGRRRRKGGRKDVKPHAWSGWGCSAGNGGATSAGSGREAKARRVQRGSSVCRGRKKEEARRGGGGTRKERRKEVVVLVSTG